MRRFVVGAMACAMLGTGTARAQGTGSGVFVSGAMFAGFEKHAQGTLALPGNTIAGDPDSGGTVPGGGFGVGAWLAPRVTVHLEAAFLGSTEADYTLSLNYPQTLLDQYVALPDGIIFPPTSYATRYRQKVSTNTVSALVGYHPAARGRLRIGLLAGLAIVRHRAEITITRNQPGLPPLVPPATQTETVGSVFYPKGVALGADGEFRATSHLSIVPQIRVVAFSDDVSIRPGAAVRWTW